MDNLVIARDNILGKIQDIEVAQPSLGKKLKWYREEKARLQTKALLGEGKSRENDIAQLGVEVTKTSQKIDDNENILANLKLKLCKVEKGIRISAIAKNEQEYKLILDKLGSLPEAVSKAYEEVDRTISNLHSLSQEYRGCKNKRRLLLEKFRSFMDVEEVEAISAGINITALSEDDDICRELHNRMSEIIQERTPLKLSTMLKSASPLLLL